MTPKEFLSACSKYFGAWPADKPGVSDAVTEYLATKRPAFLSALWPMVRDARPVGFGPPDMACLLEHAESASEYMRTHAPMLSFEARPVKMIDDGPRATMADLRAALAATQAKLAEKEAEMKKLREGPTPPPAKPKAFAHLDDVRWDAPVHLSPEFYDTMISEQTRMESYAARYKMTRGKKESIG